ncbi:hypothetical protein COBT_001862 [Conglomerata obtusa]
MNKNFVSLIMSPNELEIAIIIFDRADLIKFEFEKNFFWFFEKVDLELLIVLRIVIKYATRQSRYSIKAYFDLSLATIDEILIKIMDRIRVVDFRATKLEGPRKQIFKLMKLCSIIRLKVIEENNH